MRNYEYIIKNLGDKVLDYCWSSLDLNPKQSFEFVDDQMRLNSSTFYIADANTLAKRIKTIAIEPGTIIFVGNVIKANTFYDKAQDYGFSVIECACSCSTLFNSVFKSIELLRENLINTQDSVTNDDMQHHLRHLWKLIQNRTLVNKREIYEAFANVGPSINKYYRLIVIHTELPRHAISEVDIIDQLWGIMPNCYLFSNPNKPGFEIIAIQFFSEQAYEKVDNLDDIEELYRQYKLYSTCSNSTRDYSRMFTIYHLVQRSNYIAYMLTKNEQRRYHFYKDYSMYMILDFCADAYRSQFGHEDIIYLGHPAAIHLFRYDQQHGTNLLEVLYYYLLNNQDIKKTSTDLFMHRNTVTNKLNLIKKLCPADFEDGNHNELLLFTCQLIRYYESVLHHMLKNNITTIEEEENAKKDDKAL